MKNIIRFSIYILLLGVFYPVCACDDDSSKTKEYIVNFNQTDISLKEGKRQLLVAEFNKEAGKLDYNWKNSNPAVVELVRIMLPFVPCRLVRQRLHWNQPVKRLRHNVR